MFTDPRCSPIIVVTSSKVSRLRGSNRNPFTATWRVTRFTAKSSPRRHCSLLTSILINSGTNDADKTFNVSPFCLSIAVSGRSSIDLRLRERAAIVRRVFPRIRIPLSSPGSVVVGGEKKKKKRKERKKIFTSSDRDPWIVKTDVHDGSSFNETENE